MEKMTHKTMEDFAKSCGVSRPTLSKYFDDPTSVKPVTRALIEAALRSSNYQPNIYARNLNRKRTRNIGILVPALTDPFYAEMVNRLELRLRDEGYWPIVFSSHGLPELEREAVNTMLSLKVAGAVAAPLGQTSHPRAFERLAQNVPIVYFDTYIEGNTPFIGNDNRQSVATIVEYLCRSGEAPAYLDIPHVNHNSPERLASYIATMEASGHEPLVIKTTASYTWEFEHVGYQQMDDILNANTLPRRTILCANDRLAFGVMAAAFAHGLKVGRKKGDDLRIAAHDDHPLSRYTCPPLTTMAQDFAAMTANSVDSLLALLGDTDAPAQAVAPMVRLNGTLVMRQSA
ncbi:LacI family DNA-binding transcriptional regulator [Rhizobium lusitanum]|jgi:DNA-binding LacI/PurR family transcriptional regulator|uniref:Transcriptional regulator, LacI family n=1 Tax=Rhizobium lusitanum TaxID=293958 RepID=A0A1C3XDZ9_9HYPH|nr:LacI family DNA-binding transcriptional regulator [Rhizobium lusitanum]NRP89380.1 Ribose operon repressor [Ensifer adhaerens]NTJ11127.1 LacI family transcriptional regulator [Rhizobium lusitanum]SCB50439.1 transcriptional regulator, LacI family [Rhizobium lusitanum]